MSFSTATPVLVNHPVLGDFRVATVDFARCGVSIALIKFRINAAIKDKKRWTLERGFKN